ncbi:uncharacterized protein [Henckelia pumila]|uniref:uncharacterized protein n=1 Tax=Henckelia pumila TaxID=405737 RepID=UPI003C6E1550
MVEDLRGAMADNANQSEDPHKHLMEFHVVCTSMKPHGNAAKDWLYYLPPGSITTWTEMKRIFLEKYFPASRAANIIKEIYGIKQNQGESLHEYWERFKKLCASCPQHQISENLLIQYCYESLLSHDRNMLDAASGGFFVDKTPIQARNLIENMAANSQQFGTNERNRQNMRVCGICTAKGHATNMCLTLQEGSTEQVNAAGGFPGPPQRNYYPYLNTNNPGWKDHQNLRYGNPAMNQPAPPVNQLNNQAYRPLYPPPQRPQIPTPGEFLENIVKDLETNTLNFQHETRAIIQHFNTQVGQLETAVNRLEAQNASSLPSQIVVNPKENVSAITLRSGKELKAHEEVVQTPIKKEEVEESKLEENEIIQEAPRGDVQLEMTMLDLGASINVMPYSVYAYLKLRPLNETAIVIQMADRSTIFPRGVLEDVFVQVEHTKDVNEGNLKEVMAKPVENFNAKFFLSDLQAPKIEPKLPPDRAKGMPKEKGRSGQETGISKKSKQNKHRQKISAKLFKWVKVDKGTRYEPP